MTSFGLIVIFPKLFYSPVLLPVYLLAYQPVLWLVLKPVLWLPLHLVLHPSLLVYLQLANFHFHARLQILACRHPVPQTLSGHLALAARALSVSPMVPLVAALVVLVLDDLAVLQWALVESFPH